MNLLSIYARLTEIKLYKSPWLAIKMILLCSVFVAIGIWGLKTGEMPALICWLSIGFFGLGYPVGLFHLFDRRPQIIINEIGIFDRTTHKDFINWEIIKGAYPIDIYRQKFICLIVDGNFRPSKRKSKKRQYIDECFGQAQQRRAAKILTIDIRITEQGNINLQ